MGPLARASVFIQAAPSVVWHTLLAPETIPRILPVGEVLAAWREAAAFAWTFDLNGLACRVDGYVHQLEPPRLLAYEYVDPHARVTRGITNVHQVRIELAPEGSGTRISLSEDAHVSPAAHAHAEGGWRLAFHNLKAVSEARAALQGAGRAAPVSSE